MIEWIEERKKERKKEYTPPQSFLLFFSRVMLQYNVHIAKERKGWGERREKKREEERRRETNWLIHLQFKA